MIYRTTKKCDFWHPQVWDTPEVMRSYRENPDGSHYGRPVPKGTQIFVLKGKIAVAEGKKAGWVRRHNPDDIEEISALEELAEQAE